MRNALQKFDPRVLGQSLTLGFVTQAFARVLHWRSLSSARPFSSSVTSLSPNTQLKVVRSVEFHFPSNHIESITLKVSSSERAPDTSTKSIEQNRMTFEEYKEKHVLTFEQYCDECGWLVEPPSKEHPEDEATVLSHAYEIYVITCYNNYKAKFEPRSNPFILDL
jgi:hypothetical protein